MDKSRMNNLHSLINDIFTKFLSGKNLKDEYSKY